MKFLNKEDLTQFAKDLNPCSSYCINLAIEIMHKRDAAFAIYL